MALYHLAILEINPDAQFTIQGDDEAALDNIEWNNGTTPISKADIIAKEAEIVARDAHMYPRLKAYPSIVEQLDMRYWDLVNGTTNWRDAITAVKTAHPKAE